MDLGDPKGPKSTGVNFQYRSSISVGGEGAAEISAYDPNTEKLFIVNGETAQISVYSLADLDNPVEKSAIDVSGYGAPNSVAVEVAQNPGSVLVYETEDQRLTAAFSVGALPDMVTFTRDGKTILSANEGEPNDDYSVDPLGSVSIISLPNDELVTLDFMAFNRQEADLEAQGFRVFGPNATLAQDVEPEYIAVSENSRIAWVSLQENNGIAKINIRTKAIEAIYPLGFKDYSLSENSLDASDEDGVKELKTWPVVGMYQPDALVSAKIMGTDYVFSANEGDACDYDTFSEEERIEDLLLDPFSFAPKKTTSRRPTWAGSRSQPSSEIRMAIVNMKSFTAMERAHSVCGRPMVTCFMTAVIALPRKPLPLPPSGLMTMTAEVMPREPSRKRWSC